MPAALTGSVGLHLPYSRHFVTETAQLTYCNMEATYQKLSREINAQSIQQTQDESYQTRLHSENYLGELDD